MKRLKRLLCVLTALMLLSGCQKDAPGENSSENISSGTNNSGKPQNNNSETAQPCTIKWCLPSCKLDDDIIGKINAALYEDGCQYDVELIQIPQDPVRSYEEQVREYEESSGSLDVVSAGYGYITNMGAGYRFIKSGYFTRLDNLSDFTAVPEKLWETVKVSGEIYTVPGLNFNDSSTTVFFNKAYISEDKIAAFDGDLNKLGDMLSGLSADKKFSPIYYNPDYADFAVTRPYTIKGGLLLDNVSHKAVVPYEYDDFKEHARTLNNLYRAGYFGNGINFSEYDYPAEDSPKDFAVMVSLIGSNSEYFEFAGYGDFDLVAYTMPNYLENRVLGSTGVAANSEHKEQAFDFLKRLYSDNKYAEIIYNGTDVSDVDALDIGAPKSETRWNYDDMFVSDFAGFDLEQKDIDTELCELLSSSFDRLCKSEDFDDTLTKINNELKQAGIDDYIAHVNKVLEESNAFADQ